VDLERLDIHFIHCSADFRDIQNLSLGNGRRKVGSAFIGSKC
jgi:hypothetical protein